MMKLHKVQSALAALACLAAVSAGAPASAELKVIISNDNSNLGLKGQTFEVLQKEIEKALGADAKVELYNNGALFDQKSSIQGAQLGSANFIAPGQAVYASLAPNLSIMSLPFMLSTPQQVQQAIEDPVINKTFFPDLEAKGLKVVAVWMNGPRDVSSRTDKPIEIASDMEGIKIRVQPTSVDVASMKALGASPQSMDITEVPTALQQGVIDGVEITPNALGGSGLAEVLRQTIRVSWRYDFYLLATGKAWWDGLTDDQRAGLTTAIRAATDWNIAHAGEVNDAAYKKLADTGYTIREITPEQRQTWIDASRPVWKTYGEDLVGTDVIDRLKEIAGIKDK